MAFIHFGEKTINFKIVYYGPAQSGKTTNLKRIHEHIDPGVRGDLTILSTRQDRTLFFDFLPLRSDIITGYVSKFQLYTVPGQVIYNQTRKLVLQGVDGVVFVADSAWDRMEDNAESFENLASNLQEQGMSVERLPVMLQFNKRDLEDKAPTHYMDYLLNRLEKRMPTCEAVACASEGVFETLNMVARMTLASFIKKNGLSAGAVPNEVCAGPATTKASCSAA